MNAADGIQSIFWIDRARALLTRANIAVVVLGVLFLVAFRTGKTNGVNEARAAVADSVRTVLADSSKVIERREIRRADSLIVAHTVAEAARAVYLPARAKVTVVSDTVVRIDTALVEVPREIVRAIQASDTLIASQAREISLLTVQLRDVAADRDVWKRRALMDEVQLAARKPSRFGFKSGATVGALSVLAIAIATR